MKRLVVGALCCLLLACAGEALAGGDLFDEAVRRAKGVSGDIPSGAAISVARTVLSREEVRIVVMDGKTVVPPFERFVFVFVDDVPGANWAHPCVRTPTSRTPSHTCSMTTARRQATRNSSPRRPIWTGTAWRT